MEYQLIVEIGRIVTAIFVENLSYPLGVTWSDVSRLDAALEAEAKQHVAEVAGQRRTADVRVAVHILIGVST